MNEWIHRDKSCYLASSLHTVLNSIKVFLGQSRLAKADLETVT